MRDPELHFTEPGPIDWAAVFGRDADVELELGFGKARFLIESARARPDADFFGVERSLKWYREGRRRILKDPPANLRVCRAEALDFLARRVPTGSLRVLHVYHPDPWPKRRHRKRRLLTPALLAEALRCLAPGGELRVTTDHHDYSLAIGELLAAEPRLVALPWELDDPDTHFEAKYRKEGRSIHRFRYRLAEPA